MLNSPHPRSSRSGKKKTTKKRDAQKTKRKKRAPLRTPDPKQAARHSKVIQQNLEEAAYIVFDIETTGGNPERNGITEIYALRYKNGEILDTFYTMVNPKVSIPPIVRRMTGITNKMVRDKPLIEEVMPKFLEFIGDDILVSHNTIGDLRFLVHFARKACNVEPHNYFMCTHLLTEKLIPEAPDKSLKGLSQFLQLSVDNFHRAEVDAHITLSLHQELLSRLEKKSIKVVEDAIRLQGDLESGLRVGWGLDEDSLKQLPNTPGVFFLYDKQGKPLFLSSVFNLHRDINKLKRYQVLPRNLLKLVLQAYKVDTTAHPNIFEAMLVEGESLIRNKLRFDPNNWHLRSLQVLYVTHDEEGIRVALGQLSAGAKHAFGLIHDRKEAQKMLDRLAEVFGVRASRKGILLPRDRENALLAFFNGTLKSELKEVRSKLFSFKSLFNAKERKRFSELYSEIKGLVKIEPVSGIKQLLNHSGVVVGTGEKENIWRLYPIIDSVPYEPVIVEGDWENWLIKSPQGKRFIENLKSNSGQRIYQPISTKESAKVNAAIWMMFGNRNKKLQSHGCAFFPLDEIEKPNFFSDETEKSSL